MTVKDLIEKLAKMPPDALVVIDMYSECQALADDQPKLRTDFIERNGTYFKYNSVYWDEEKDGNPKFITVCNFPGN